MGWLFHLSRKEKIFENTTTHFMFEKTNNPDVNPNLKLKDQAPQILDRLMKNIKKTDIGL